MKKTVILLSAFLLAASIFVGCNSKPKAMEVKDLIAYNDEAYGFSIKYPSNWYAVANQTVVPGKHAIIYTEKKVVDRFSSYASDGTTGARISMSVLKLSGDTTMEKIMSQQTLKVEYSAAEKTTIDGTPAFRKTYKHNFDDGEFNGEVYYATKDGKIATIITFEAFGGTFAAYRATFDEILKSAKLAVIPASQMPTTPGDSIVVVNAPPPSSTLVTKQGSGYSISIPDNYNAVNNPAKTGTFSSVKYIGERKDSYIQVDVIDASKAGELDKITKDLQAVFKGVSGASSTTISGAKANLFNYAAAKDVSGRVYLALKDRKLYRIVMTWVKAEESDYLGTFEKCVKSIQF